MIKLFNDAILYLQLTYIEKLIEYKKERDTFPNTSEKIMKCMKTDAINRTRFEPSMFHTQVRPNIAVVIYEKCKRFQDNYPF
jgi:hypothetical protein